MFNKKAQISDTLNWIVATLVIVVILSICLFLVWGDILKNNLFFRDKQKDFIVTNSFTNFVKDNFELVKSSVEDDEYSLLKKESQNFLKEQELPDIWAIDFFVDGERKFTSNNLGSKGTSTFLESSVMFELNNKKVFFRIWIDNPKLEDTAEGYQLY